MAASSTSDGGLYLANSPTQHGSWPSKLQDAAGALPSSVTGLKPLQKVLNLGGRRSPVPYPTRPNVSSSSVARPAEEPRESISLQPLSQSTQPEHDSPPALEAAREDRQAAQERPDQLPNLLAEVIFVLVCSFGFLFSVAQSTNASVLQLEFIEALDLPTAEAPWLVGSFLLASGLSVVVSGSVADLVPPKAMMIAAFTWSTLWSIIGCFSIAPSRQILFFLVRAMQGVACGALSSVPMSILGRVYKPGQRKNKVFATMGAMAPLGSLLGALQGGALQHHLPWVFGSSALICGVLGVATVLTVPTLSPEGDGTGAAAPSMRDFDFLGAGLAVAGCACILSGLTQGSPTGWTPYTYTLIVIGALLLGAFGYAERWARRPLVSNRLWSTPGFAPLALAYFLGFGSFIGGYQFYAFRFWLAIQQRRPILLAAYKTPDAIAGVVATFAVAKLMHRVRGHWILIAAMLFYALGPVFFLWQQPRYPYWAVMPGVALAALGPDLSFTAAAVFITSSVERDYQGSAGSVLVTIQNLSAAVVTAMADSIAAGVTRAPAGELDLPSLRATWWFGFALAMSGAAVCAVALRMPKSEEKEHVA